MNRREQIAKQELESEGWTVQKVGWPDFLCFRRGGEIKAVEVKSSRQINRELSGLTSEQAEALVSLGRHFPTEVHFVNNEFTVRKFNYSSPPIKTQIAAMTDFNGLGLS